jgi:hypothetical protein
MPCGRAASAWLVGPSALHPLPNVQSDGVGGRSCRFPSLNTLTHLNGKIIFKMHMFLVSNKFINKFYFILKSFN